MRAEMSQHSQRTQQGPSVGSIVAGGVLVLVAAMTSSWIINSPALTWREVAGSVAASVLAILLTGQTVGRVIERRIIIDRAERTERREAERRAANTGTWEGDAGERLTVRYEPTTGAYWAEGWISDHWQIRPETVWPDRATLVHTLAELENSGEMIPWNDEGTRAVRARLDLPGWDVDEMVASVTQPEEPAPSAAVTASFPAPRLADEQTRRLTVPPTVPGHGPSPAALRPIEVPVFRTEADRAAWAAERDIPTEILPLDPRWRA